MIFLKPSLIVCRYSPGGGFGIAALLLDGSALLREFLFRLLVLGVLLLALLLLNGSACSGWGPGFAGRIHLRLRLVRFPPGAEFGEFGFAGFQFCLRAVGAACFRNFHCRRRLRRLRLPRHGGRAGDTPLRERSETYERSELVAAVRGLRPLANFA